MSEKESAPLSSSSSPPGSFAAKAGYTHEWYCEVGGPHEGPCPDVPVGKQESREASSSPLKDAFDAFDANFADRLAASSSPIPTANYVQTICPKCRMSVVFSQRAPGMMADSYDATEPHRCVAPEAVSVPTPTTDCIYPRCQNPGECGCEPSPAPEAVPTPPTPSELQGKTELGVGPTPVPPIPDDSALIAEALAAAEELKREHSYRRDGELMAMLVASLGEARRLKDAESQNANHLSGRLIEAERQRDEARQVITKIREEVEPPDVSETP